MQLGIDAEDDKEIINAFWANHNGDQEAIAEEKMDFIKDYFSGIILAIEKDNNRTVAVKAAVSESALIEPIGTLEFI